MTWLIFVAIATIFDALRIFIDNYSSDVYFKKREAVSQKLFYGYANIVIAIIILFVTNFNFLATDFGLVLLLILSGCLTSFSGIPYYRALELDDSINLGIFIQIAPILYLVIGWILFNEAFSPLQLIAFIVILAAPLLIILTTRKRSRKVKIKAILYAFLYVLIAVIGNIVFVKAPAESMDFTAKIAFIFIGKGITNVLLVYARPKWHNRFRNVLKASHYKVLRPLIVNQCVGTVKDFAYRIALTTAPTLALASAASDSVEPIVIFFIGILLTLIWPKFGREKLDRKSIIVHLVATILVVTGIILLQN